MELVERGRKSYMYGEFTDQDGLKFLICERGREEKLSREEKQTGAFLMELPVLPVLISCLTYSYFF